MGSKFDHVAAENEKSGQFGHLRLLGTNAGWKTMNLDTMDKPCVPFHPQRQLQVTLTNMFLRDVYKLLISAVVPRPSALVSSLSETGEANLAPFR